MTDATAKRTARTLHAQPLTALPRDHGTADVVRINGREVAYDGQAWTWTDTREPLSFDQCELYGLDGSGRSY